MDAAWRTIGTSACGSSHRRRAVPCQDACRYAACAGGAGPVAVLAAADGAGSAPQSQAGADAAVSAAVAALLARIGADDAADLDERDVRSAVDAARDAVVARGVELDVPARDLACTLLVAVLTESATFAAHLGDGAIVLDEGCGLRVLTWPEQGEYANDTYFLTDDDAVERARFVRGGRAVRAALITDGLQNLALRYDEGKPFAGFFDPFFAYLESSGAPDAEIERQLHEYLSSPAIAARTDDDATLVLAVRT